MIVLIPFACTTAQNVGINVPNPAWPLDISAGQGVIRLGTTTSTYGSVLELKNINGSASYIGAINFNDAVNLYPGQIGYLSDHNLTFRTNTYERMRLDSEGRLGIGTINPTYTLDVHAEEANLRLNTNSALGAEIVLTTTVPNSVYLGQISFKNVSGTATGYIKYGNDNRMIFYTNSIDRVIINGEGRVGMSISPNEYRLNVSGNASKSVSGEWMGNSDARLKKNIQPLNSQLMLDKLLMLDGITYEWNDDITGYTRPEGIQYGFTAQNIQQVFPTLVEEDNLGYYQTAYGTYDAMVVEAIRALDTKIKLLQAENDELKQIIKNGRSKRVGELKKELK